MKIMSVPNVVILNDGSRAFIHKQRGEVMEKIYVVGQYIKGETSNIIWHIQGVFDTEEKALEACLNERYFIGPINMNEALPDKSVLWPGVYYPFSEKETI